MAPKKNKKPGLGVRQIAANVLQSVLAGRVFEPVTANQVAEGRDRALVNRLVTTALRRHAHISQVLDANLSRGLPKRSGIFEAAVRLALAEILYVDEESDHAAAFLCVEIVRSDKRARRFDKLANGVVRQAQRDAEKWKNLPDDALFAPAVFARWQKAHGEDFEQNISAWGAHLRTGAPLDISVKKDAQDWAQKLGGVALNAQTVRVVLRDKPVTELEGFETGDWWVQDVAAALPATLLKAPSGARVLDLCAAPGGKTAQLANAGYDVMALDLDARRMERVEQNLQRLGFDAEIVVGDALTYAPDQKFDAILLDAPCSATGTFRRHPEVLINRSDKDIGQLAKLQGKMIDQAVSLLKVGGSLVYCTCSMEPAEGEQQIHAALKRHSGLKIDPIDPQECAQIAGAVQKDGTVRTHAALLVGEAQGMDGFFCARLSLESAD